MQSFISSVVQSFHFLDSQGIKQVAENWGILLVAGENDIFYLIAHFIGILTKRFQLLPRTCDIIFNT